MRIDADADALPDCGGGGSFGGCAAIAGSSVVGGCLGSWGIGVLWKRFCNHPGVPPARTMSSRDRGGSAICGAGAAAAGNAADAPWVANIGGFCTGAVGCAPLALNTSSAVCGLARAGSGYADAGARDAAASNGLIPGPSTGLGGCDTGGIKEPLLSKSFSVGFLRICFRASSVMKISFDISYLSASSGLLGGFLPCFFM